MFKKTLTAAVAVLTLAGASLAPTAPAQAGSLGRFIAAGIVGAVVGSAIAGNARSAHAYRPAHGGYEGGYRPVRGGYDEGCGLRLRPVFDEDGNQVGTRRVPAC